MNLPFQFCTVHQMTDDEALLDSGATENFLDEQVQKSLKIGHFQLKRPLTINNINGTKN